MSSRALEEFENRIELRAMEFGDFDAIVALQLSCFPSMKPWSRAQFESLVRVFPDGQTVVVVGERIVASSSSLIVDYREYDDWHDWMTVSDNGMIRNHDPEGDTLYGIEIQVDPEHRGKKLARRLYEARKEYCRRHNLARILVGGRIPGFAVHRETLSANAYVDRVRRKELHDPVLTTQLANGFALRQIVEDYLPSDEDSAGYATILEWSNLEYQPPGTRRRSRRAYEPVRVASVQYQMRSISSWEDFARQIEFHIDVASDAKSDFVCLPELIVLQLLSLVGEHETGAAARELTRFAERYLALFNDLAVRYNINVIAGSLFEQVDSFVFNSAFLFRRNGTIARQPKIHVTPNERRWWGVTGGNTLEVFDSDCGPIAILVCYDVEFPELARRVSELGARVLFVPFNTNDRQGYLRVRLCAQARAIENQLYVVTSGCVGNLPFVENADLHYAQSGIFTPSDVSFARDGVAEIADPNVETVLVQDLDLQLLARARRSGTVQTWNDRRLDLYNVVWRRSES
ncbi:MAG: GNAT family N-acetyltransferase [Myxococcota bacterium]